MYNRIWQKASKQKLKTTCKLRLRSFKHKHALSRKKKTQTNVFTISIKLFPFLWHFRFSWKQFVYRCRSLSDNFIYVNYISLLPNAFCIRVPFKRQESSNSAKRLTFLDPTSMFFSGDFPSNVLSDGGFWPAEANCGLPNSTWIRTGVTKSALDWNRNKEICLCSTCWNIERQTAIWRQPAKLKTE